MSEIVYPIFRVFSIGKNANVPHSFDTDADDRNRTQKSDRPETVALGKVKAMT